MCADRGLRTPDPVDGTAGGSVARGRLNRPGPPLQPRRGQTDQDLERITRASEAARAPGTHRIYQYAWEQWATWCAERGFEPLPADPAAMCAFMTQRVADGLAVISLSPFISVINYVHSAHGLPTPTRTVPSAGPRRAPAHLRCFTILETLLGLCPWEQ